jgi:hypothetical protein
MPLVQCCGVTQNRSRCRYHGVANVNGGMWCNYHSRQARSYLYATRCQACNHGPYWFPVRNVGFFCQQHKHVSSEASSEVVRHAGRCCQPNTLDCGIHPAEMAKPPCADPCSWPTARHRG